MKNILFVACLFVASFSFAQVKEISSKYDKIGKFNHGIAIVELKGKMGAIDTDGKEVIKPEWDNLAGFGKDGVAYAHRDGMVGLIDSKGTLLAEPVYQRIGHFKYGKAVMVRSKRQGIISLQGKVIVEPVYDELKIEEGGVIRAKKDGQETLLKETN